MIEYSRPLEGRHIVIVEDDVLLASSLQEDFLEAGASCVRTAHDVREALTLLRTETPDVVVLELTLQGKSALPLADLLFELKFPYVIASGFDKAWLKQRYRGIDIVKKPYEHRHVVEAVAGLLKEARPSA